MVGPEIIISPAPWGREGWKALRACSMECSDVQQEMVSTKPNRYWPAPHRRALPGHPRYSRRAEDTGNVFNGLEREHVPHGGGDCSHISFHGMEQSVKPLICR